MGSFGVVTALHERRRVVHGDVRDTGVRQGSIWILHWPPFSCATLGELSTNFLMYEYIIRIQFCNFGVCVVWVKNPDTFVCFQDQSTQRQHQTQGSERNTLWMKEVCVYELPALSQRSTLIGFSPLRAVCYISLRTRITESLRLEGAQLNAYSSK